MSSLFHPVFPAGPDACPPSFVSQAAETLRAQIRADEAAVRAHAHLVHAVKVQQRHLREQHVVAVAQRARTRAVTTQRMAQAQRLVTLLDRDRAERALAERLTGLEAEERVLLDRLQASQARHAAVFDALASLAEAVRAPVGMR